MYIYRPAESFLNWGASIVMPWSGAMVATKNRELSKFPCSWSPEKAYPSLHGRVVNRFLPIYVQYASLTKKTEKIWGPTSPPFILAPAISLLYMYVYSYKLRRDSDFGLGLILVNFVHIKLPYSIVFNFIGPYVCEMVLLKNWMFQKHVYILYTSLVFFRILSAILIPM